MAEVSELVYIVVVDEGEEKESFRYTRPVLQSTLQLMGCKVRHAFKISRRFFEVMKSDEFIRCWDPNGMGISQPDRLQCHHGDENGFSTSCFAAGEFGNKLESEKDKYKTKPFESYEQRRTVIVRRETFLDIVCSILAEYKYIGPNQRADLILASRIRERKESVIVLLCGTSGCGKSTLSSLLGTRLGITTIISTDSIRHMMRSFVDEKQNPLLWASTYHAGECLDPVAVAEAKTRKKAKKLADISNSTFKDDEASGGSLEEKPGTNLLDNKLSITQLISAKEIAIEGFKAQSEMVIDSLDRLITAWEERKESVIVEGVHLSLNFVMGLMKKHSSILPFMIYIRNEDKHLERFAVRAKYMALDPAKNKYVKYIHNIRAIQEYLCGRADKYLVPKINNTNVDKSVATIHATVFSCLRRRESGEHFFDPATNTSTLVYEEYRNQCAANSLSSKCMFQLIQRRGSSRHLIALINTDGSVAKAWPVNASHGHEGHILSHGGKKDVGDPMYGPLQYCKAERVNLQFGHFGLSAWPIDIGSSSQTPSVDESRVEGAYTGSRCTSTCSSPRLSEIPSKELKEDMLASGSEVFDSSANADSDGDLADIDVEETREEVGLNSEAAVVVTYMEGSVEEDSMKSDEECDDLAMQDVQKHGYWSDDDEIKE
ncbi:hypothetical protein RJ641_024948 [Dillenia turbinata]|uniref:Uncharacterized protein n=1 Tax=Dillenia turbinata TaxID=194707 RepID=A0AAN8ZN11_9MAGN